MKRHLKKYALLPVLAVGSFLARPVCAAPNLPTDFNTLYGPVGLITVPTPAVAPRNRLLLGVGLNREFKGVTANYGLTSGIDVGTGIDDVNHSNLKVIGNVKVHIVPGNFHGFDIGIGLIDFADAIHQTFYAVVGKEISLSTALHKQGASLQLTAGYGSGLFKNNVIGGAELAFTRHFSVLGEYNGKNFNAAARYAYNRHFGAQLGFADNDVVFNMTYRMHI